MTVRNSYFLLVFACDVCMKSPSALHMPQMAEQHRAPSLQSEEDEDEEEEEGSNLIRPQKPLSPLKASKSHRELHKELRMTHTRSDTDPVSNTSTAVSAAWINH